MTQQSRDENGRLDGTGTDHIDRLARRLHAGSLGALGPQTLARLRAARYASGPAAPARRTPGWWLAGSSAAGVALILIAGAYPTADAPAPQIAVPTPIEQLHAAGLGDEYRSLIAGVDENPELYLWLANNQDALALHTGTTTP